MKWLTQITTITKKELRSYFDSTTAYIVMIVFLLLGEFLFFRQAFIAGEASLASFFAIIPWLFLLLIPALTMGAVAQEKGEGTLEFLLTHPLSDRAFIVGKFLGSTALTAILLLFIFPIALSFSWFGNLDWGTVFGQYLSSVSLAALLISLGIFISSCFSNQISSLVTTAIAGFAFLIIGTGLVTSMVPGFLVSWFDALGPFSHYESMARGVLDLRDVWYFVSAIVIFLSFAYLQLLKRRIGNQKKAYQRYQFAVALIFGIALLSNVIGAWIPGRLDLTGDKIYTVSAPTKKILSGLPDIVTVTLYASSEIPGQFQSILRDTKDILRDYRTFGKGNIVVVTKDPNASAQIASEAQEKGIRPVQFNVIGKGELQLKNGYLGLAVSYGDKKEVLPFIQGTADLEYQLTSFIHKLTITDKKKIGFLTGHGEKSISLDYRLFGEELGKQFEARELTLDEKNQKIPADIAGVVIAGPSKPIEAKTRAALKEYLDKGGAGLFLLNPINVNLQTLNAAPEKENFTDFLKDYGVSVNTDLVYDLRSNASVRFGGGFLSFVLPYPLWVRALSSSSQSAITARIGNIVLPWASSLSLDENKVKEAGLTVVKLYVSSKSGGIQEGSFMLKPDSPFSQTNLSERLMAAALSGDKKTRMIVVGDSKFLADQFIQENPANMAFGVSALSWLTSEESFADLQIKQFAERKLLFTSSSQVPLVQYGNMGLALFAPLLFGIIRLFRRRGLRSRKYQKS
jgi:ABC-type transport system involved in multi-copper enzyme maturation permease subunit